jgi:hypothetical protein
MAGTLLYAAEFSSFLGGIFRLQVFLQVFLQVLLQQFPYRAVVENLFMKIIIHVFMYSLIHELNISCIYFRKSSSDRIRW